MKQAICIFFLFLSYYKAHSQIQVSGEVKDQITQEPITGVNVRIVGLPIGTTTDFEGHFVIETEIKLPFVIEFSSLGYERIRKQVNKDDQVINIMLSEKETSLKDIVISASRTPEYILESPVSIERFNIQDIKDTPSVDFYSALENLKGVDLNNGSLTFKSINTRGFSTFANTRFVQLIDGMDNSSPALNFNIGNLLGISELDVHSIELLPGASSALYGANAFNGILLINSKSSFDYQGVSMYAKGGITSQRASGDNPYIDAGVRVAKAFNDKIAAKITVSFLNGEEWWATDYKDYNNPEFTRLDPGYDGLNVYGDEISLDIAKNDDGLEKNIVTRTGYYEVDLANYNARNFKAGVSLDYRIHGDSDKLTLSYEGRIGTGNTIFQGSNRYFLQDFLMHQHKLEVHNKNFFVRVYLTEEDAGDSYDSRFAGININRKWKKDEQWFEDYKKAYNEALIKGHPENESHFMARKEADLGRFLPGTLEFENAFNEVKSDGDLASGARFIDKSKTYNSEVNYNFRDLIDFAEIHLGGSLRQYSLNSEGTIFTDYNGPIVYNEFGVYLQAQKKVINNRLKLTGSVRYDKSKNFSGNFTPRLSLGLFLGKKKEHNFRFSFQTGFRNPTAQDQYIGLDTGRAIVIGSAPDNLGRYISSPILLSSEGRGLTGNEYVELVGYQAYNNAYVLKSISSPNPADFEKAETGLVKPERVSTFEFGYRSKLNKIDIDVSGYYNKYQDLISVKTVVVPLYGEINGSVDENELAIKAVEYGDTKAFQLYTNSTADISSYGASLGLNYNIYGGYQLGASYAFAKLNFNQDTDPDFQAEFNTPEHRVKFFFGNDNAYKGIGFFVNYRWSDTYLWQSTFQSGQLPANTVVDAQVNYTLKKWKSNFKLGVSNIGENEYVSAPGSGSIGSIYYLGWTVSL